MSSANSTHSTWCQEFAKGNGYCKDHRSWQYSSNCTEDYCSRSCSVPRQAVPVELQHWCLPKIVGNCQDMTVHKKESTNPICPFTTPSVYSRSSAQQWKANETNKWHWISNDLLADSELVLTQGHSAPYLIAALMQTRTTELNSRWEVSVSDFDIKAACDYM